MCEQPMPTPSDDAVEAVMRVLPDNGPAGFGRWSPKHKREQAEAVIRAIDLSRVRAEAEALLAHARDLLAMKDAQMAEAREEGAREAREEILAWLRRPGARNVERDVAEALVERSQSDGDGSKLQGTNRPRDGSTSGGTAQEDWS